MVDLFKWSMAAIGSVISLIAIVAVLVAIASLGTVLGFIAIGLVILGGLAVVIREMLGE